MIKARVVRGVQPDLIVLGITPGNVDRLKAGQPLLVHGAELDVEFDITIVYGDSEAAVAAELREAGLNVPQVRTPRPGERRRIV